MDALKHKIEEMANDTVTQVRLRKEAWITEHEALFQSRQTPTILLLCKHVTSEALSILHDVPLAIDFKPRTRHSRDGLIFYMTENPEEARMENKMPVFKWAMMSLPTVKQVKKATFYIPNWTDGVFRVEILQPWFYLQAMCGVFKQENSRLEELRIEFSGTGGSGVGDMVWILDGRKKELVSLDCEEVALDLTIFAAQDTVEEAASYQHTRAHRWILGPNGPQRLPHCRSQTNPAPTVSID